MKMMKKMIVTAALAFLSFSLVKAGVKTTASSTFKDDSLKLRIVPMSVSQWRSIENKVNINGWCYIKEQNVVLVITNGCLEIEHYLLPMFLPKPIVDLERNPLRLEGKRGDRRKKDDVEPKPYFGQML